MFDRIEKVDVRQHFAKEAQDFTPWLATGEGLKLLSETLGLNVTDVKTEPDVGEFSSDIIGCLDGDEDRKIVVENQLEISDHDHLGKLLTYAAAVNAEVAVWIAPDFEKEHLHALSWLNDHSDGRPQYFGVELNLLKIGSSKPAPHLVVVARPGEWRKGVAATDKPWLKDGRNWHYEEQSYDENVPTLKKLLEALEGLPGVKIVDRQKEYIRIFGPKARELRVLGGQHKFRLDVVFMKLDKSQVEEALSGLDPSPTVNDEHPLIGWPFIGLADPSALTHDLVARLSSWLAEG